MPSEKASKASMYACIYGHSLKQSMDQPGKDANNPARGQLNREKYLFPCSRSRLLIWSREMSSAVQSCVSLLILHTQAESGDILLTRLLLLSATASIYI